MKEGQTQDTKKYLDEICIVCGGRRGIHQRQSQRCPANINDTIYHSSYKDTVFTPPPSPVGIDVEELANKYLTPYNAPEFDGKNIFTPQAIVEAFKAGAASLPQSSTEELLTELFLYIQADGTPVDGFRFREIAVKLKNKIDKR